ANGIENDDVVPRLGVDPQLAAARDVPAATARDTLGLVEALGFPRRNDQECVAHRRADALKGLEDRLFLTLERGGGNHDGTIGRDTEVAKDAISSAVGRPGAWQLE